jgi:hypothetical protein
MKVLVFEWGSLTATLYWCKQFQDLIELKGLDAAAKYMMQTFLPPVLPLRLIPFKPCQNHWGHDLLYHMPHHIIFLLVIMIHTSELSPHMSTLLENPCNFFTNTCHPLQHYHLSFSTKKDYISMQHSTKPWHGSLFSTSSLRQSRNNHIYFSSHSLVLIVSILLLIFTNLFNSIHHMTCHCIFIWVCLLYSTESLAW